MAWWEIARIRGVRRERPAVWAVGVGAESGRSAVVQFGLSGVLATVIIGVLAVAVSRHIGTEQAIGDAERVTRLAGEAVIAPRLDDAVLRGDPGALRRLDAVVRRGVLRHGIVRVKVWSADARVMEAMRNVHKHARARSARITVARAGGGVRLEVRDDGRGCDADTLAWRGEEGHVGLRLLHDLVADAGGRLRVEPGPRGGTIVSMDVAAHLTPPAGVA